MTVERGSENEMNKCSGVVEEIINEVEAQQTMEPG